MNALYEIGEAGSHWGPGWAGGGGPWWILFPLLWIATIGTVIWLVARRNNRRPETGTDGATSILAARYARGDIDTDEYQRRLDALRDVNG